jgi:hypothetical protein
MPSTPLRQPTPWTASPKRSDLRFIHKKLTREGKGSKGKAGRRERKGAKTQGRKENQNQKEREREREKKEIKKQTKTGHKKTKCLSIVFPFHPFPFSLTPSLFPSLTLSLIHFFSSLCDFAPLHLCVYFFLRSGLSFG